MKLGKILPAEDSVIAILAREHGPKLIEQVVKALVTGAVIKDVVAEEQDQAAVEQKVKKPSFGRRIASAALVRVATKSVPGAIIVTGGLIAKALHDRHQARRSAGTPRKLR